MAKIRTIKPELFRHEALFEAEQASNLPLRLAFMGLFTCCDREGRFRWRPRALKLDIFPYDNIDFSIVLDALLRYKFVRKYPVENEWYGDIPSWHKHQHINNREAVSYLPALDEEERIFSEKEQMEFLNEDSSENTKNAVSDDVAVVKSSNDKIKKQEKFSSHQTILEIFQFWQKILDHPQAKLDSKRKDCIVKALASGYTASQLCEAIQGCSLTPHNMGKNDRGERYDGLHIIFKSADNIERFIYNYHHPPSPQAVSKTSQISLKSRLNHESFDNKQYTQTPIEQISWMQGK